MKQFLIFLLFLSIISSGSNAQTEPKMVFVKGGTYSMGSKNGDGDEKPVIEVVVKDFYISKCEITVKEYKIFCDSTGRKMPDPPIWGWKDDYPMVFVSWKDAGAYTLWLARKTGKKFRLPYEKEWEFAARGGTKTKSLLYSGSNEIDDVAWYFETTYGSGPQPVGMMQANELGLHDMSGNVWEWCKDQYSFSYETKQTPNGNSPNGQNYRVQRGGAWDTHGYHARSTNRTRNDPASSNRNVGFRIVYRK